MRRPLALIAALALVAGTGAGTAAVATSKSSSPAVKTRHTALGTILVDAKGRTLYLFEKDTKNKSKCSGQCAVNWPPALTSGHPTAGGGAATSKLATTRRSDGKTQLTYAGHPLYRFVADQNKPGATKGEGIDAFGAEWYVLGTNGKKIEKGGSSGGY
jgi:predicted lipoprotein with Yx(FWY)xxD motif